jgi:hypothetical protein
LRGRTEFPEMSVACRPGLTPGLSVSLRMPGIRLVALGESPSSLKIPVPENPPHLPASHLPTAFDRASARGYCNGYVPYLPEFSCRNLPVLHPPARNITKSGLCQDWHGTKISGGLGVYSISSEAALINRAILEVAQSPLTGRNAVEPLRSKKAGRKRFMNPLAGALARQTPDA